MNSTDIQKKQLVSDLIQAFGKTASRKDVIAFVKQKDLKMPNWLINGAVYRAARGLINLDAFGSDKVNNIPAIPQPQIQDVPALQAQVVQLRQKRMVSEVEDLVPVKDTNYVPFGFYKDLESIIKSKVFYPVFITGLTGNGKTTMVEQVCSKLKRECVRVNVSIETDEDDLVGGSTLIDGNVTFREGPVILAMRRGAVLLIDEIDRGSNKLMCIQGILEGKPYFPITVEQEYPSAKVERTIIMNNMEQHSCVDEEFADKLVTWAEVIRRTYLEDAVDELISTRRLVHIVKAFSMFKDRQKAIELCINRFDSDTKNAFLDLYKKMESPVEEPVAPIQEQIVDDEIPF